MKIEPDRWLTSIFGYDVLRIEDVGEKPLLTHDALLTASPDSRFFCYVKVPVEHIAHLNSLIRTGFNVIDVNITFERKPALVKKGRAQRFSISEFLPEDKDPVEFIAKTSFIYSRFHKDPNISIKTANLIKKEWVVNYFNGERGEKLLVAKKGRRSVGFLAISRSKRGSENIRVIDLIGIHPEYQQMGAGRQLVEAFISDSVQTCDLLRVGTQVCNYPSLHLYEKCGFSIAEAAYVLHAHVQDGRVIS
jgi:GNAT superfamily N-acetyltransferase